MSETKERPILFSGPMVRALFSGAKTQTRRVVKPSVVGFVDGAPCSRIVRARLGDVEEHTEIRCPYGRPGDRLWVRETWGVDDERMKEGIPRVRPKWVTEHDPVLYRADGECCAQIPECACGWTKFRLWRPSIHMPRWASRLTLEITGVRVERVQDISEEDARAEGVGAAPFCKAGRATGQEHVEAFEDLWCDINGAASWVANPWVWVVEFRRVA